MSEKTTDSDTELKGATRNEAESPRVIDLIVFGKEGIVMSPGVQGITNYCVAIFSETTTAAVNAPPAHCHQGKRKKISYTHPSAMDPIGCPNFAPPSGNGGV